MESGADIGGAGWRQGAFLDAATVEGAVVFPTAPFPCRDAWFMVISQDCDLVHGDFEAEPVAELLHCAPAVEVQPAWHHGKDPRRLQFEVRRSAGDTLWLNAFPHGRAFLPRHRLASLQPDASLTLAPPAVRMVTAWLAKRYIRPAYPDAFNRRLKPAERKILSLLKKHGGPLDQILLGIHPCHLELEDGTPYQIIVVLVVTEEVWGLAEARTTALQAESRLRDALANLPGIHLLDCRLRRESEVTLDDARQLQPWSFDHLTHRLEATESHE